MNKKLIKIQSALANKSGETYVDTAIKIIIAVVIGALLLGLLVTLMRDTVFKTVTDKVESLFDYAGEVGGEGVTE